LRLAMKEATASKFIGLLISDGPNALKMAKPMLRKAAIRLREPPRRLRREQRQPRKWRTLRVSARLHGDVTAGLGWTMATTEVPFHPMLYDLFARSELPVQSGYTSPKKKRLLEEAYLRSNNFGSPSLQGASFLWKIKLITQFYKALCKSKAMDYHVSVYIYVGSAGKLAFKSVSVWCIAVSLALRMF
jgi:hypothetical protein